MQIVLHEGVSGLGNRGDIVDVTDGYARNFLIPQGLASRSTEGAKAQADAMRRTWQLKNAKEREAAEEVAKVLVAKSVVITARASGEGRLYGSVSAADIATAVRDQTGIELDRRSIDTGEGVHEVGTHTVTARPHDAVQFPITIEVAPA
ncbi:MAG: 50S ribosomal protein L9 [Acidimicrobiales bacterium]